MSHALLQALHEVQLPPRDVYLPKLASTPLEDRLATMVTQVNNCAVAHEGVRGHSKGH